MNKAEIMRQKDMDSVLENFIRHQPGVTSQKLYDVCKEWAGQHWTEKDTHEFDLRLAGVLFPDSRLFFFLPAESDGAAVRFLWRFGFDPRDRSFNAATSVCAGPF